MIQFMLVSWLLNCNIMSIEQILAHICVFIFPCLVKSQNTFVRWDIFWKRGKKKNLVDVPVAYIQYACIMIKHIKYGFTSLHGFSCYVPQYCV